MRARILSGLLVCCVLVPLLAQSAALAFQDRGNSKDSKDAKPASSADRYPAPNPRPPFKWWTIDKYKRELKLTTEQTAQIDVIFQASMDRLRVDKDDFDRAQTIFSELMQKNSVAERDFQRAVDQLELTRYNVSKERTTMLVRIHNLLTPEQRRGLEAIRKRNDEGKERH